MPVEERHLGADTAANSRTLLRSSVHRQVAPQLPSTAQGTADLNSWWTAWRWHISSTAALAEVAALRCSLSARSQDRLSTDTWGVRHQNDASCNLHGPVPASACGQDPAGAGISVRVSRHSALMRPPEDISSLCMFTARLLNQPAPACRTRSRHQRKGEPPKLQCSLGLSLIGEPAMCCRQHHERQADACALTGVCLTCLCDLQHTADLSQASAWHFRSHLQHTADTLKSGTGHKLAQEGSSPDLPHSFQRSSELEASTVAARLPGRQGQRP